MTVRIMEGGAYWAYESLLYPSIGSCLTLTCVFGPNDFVGGHCVLFPDKTGTQLDAMGVAKEMARLEKSFFAKPKRFIYAIGALDFWAAGVRKPLYKELGAEVPGIQLIEISIDRWAPEDSKSVDILFDTGQVKLLKVRTSHVLTGCTFGQTM